MSLLLVAILLFSALPLSTTASTVTRIDEFRFAANPNAIALRPNETVAVWMNNLKNANNGIGKGVMAAADTEGWKVNSIAGIYDGTEGRMLRNSE